MPPKFAPDRVDFYLDDPAAAFKQMRASDPLHWYEPGQFWCATKYADICEISRRPKIFSSAYGTQLFELPDRLSGKGPPETEVAPSIIRMDPPEHNRHRKIVMDVFTPKRVAGLEGRIRQIARESLEPIECGKQVDFVESLAIPLPMFMIAELLGVPASDYEDFKRWSDVMIEAGSGGVSETTIPVITELFQYFAAKAAECRAAPKNDVLSRIITAEIDGESLTDPEVAIFCLTLLVAGNETTRNLISGGMLALLENPDQLERLRAEPSLLVGAVEEMLRYVTPVRNFVRRVMKDTTLNDRELKEGQYVALFYGSANRDEEVFGEDSEVFDITRSNASRHIAFGFGEHLCLGASLARLEARVFFEELFAMRPNLELAGPVRPLASRLMNGILEMPVIFRD